MRRPRVLARYVAAPAPLRFLMVWSDARQRWVKGHPSVMLAPCLACNAKKRSPCEGPHGTHGDTHVARRALARPCPTCQADVGVLCRIARSKIGKSLVRHPWGKVHLARYLLGALRLD